MRFAIRSYTVFWALLDVILITDYSVAELGGPI